MHLEFKKRLLLAAVMLPLVSAVTWAQESPIEFKFQIVGEGPEEAAVWLQKAAELSGEQPSSHWMGVVVRPTDALLQKHLRIKGGLVVQHVAEESPAAKAGIQVDDILLAMNDASVVDLKGLMHFLTENKDQEATLWYLREGKKKSTKVTPTERPEGDAKFFQLPQIGNAKPWDVEGKTPEEIRKWIEEMAKQGGAAPWKADGDHPLKMRFFHPGVILGGDIDIDVDVNDLPEGLQVIVIKQGDKPAQIQVKKGNDEWKVTEKELDQLPEDIRAHVKNYLGKAGHPGIRIERPKALQVKPLEGGRIQQLIPRVQAHAFRIDEDDDAVGKQLDQINQRLERIEKSLQKLVEE